MATTRLTRQDADRHLTLAVGDQLVLQLDESPTSGYAWVLQATGDSLALQSPDLAGTAVPGKPGGPGVVGGGGHRLFQFSARLPGTTLLQLKLMQAWAGDASAVDTFSVTVHTLPA